MFLNHIESGAPTLEHREATPHPQDLPVCVPLSVPRGWGKIRRGRLEDSQFAPGRPLATRKTQKAQILGHSVVLTSAPRGHSSEQ